MFHDFDCEMYPNPLDHPLKGSEILGERGSHRTSIYPYGVSDDLSHKLQLASRNDALKADGVRRCQRHSL